MHTYTYNTYTYTHTVCTCILYHIAYASMCMHNYNVHNHMYIYIYYMCIYTYIYIYVYIYIWLYIYIYRERDSEIEGVKFPRSAGDLPETRQDPSDAWRADFFHRLPNGVRTNGVLAEVPQYTMTMTSLWHNYGTIMGIYGTSIFKKRLS